MHMPPILLAVFVRRSIVRVLLEIMMMNLLVLIVSSRVHPSLFSDRLHVTRENATESRSLTISFF